MEEVKVVEASDPYKDCDLLLYSIKEADHLLKYANKRHKFPDVFMSYPICLPIVQIDALRNKLILKDRIDYLNSLYEIKQCTKPLKHTSKGMDQSSMGVTLVKRVDLIPTP